MEPSDKSLDLARQAIECHHHAANRCDCGERRRALALVIDNRIRTAASAMREMCAKVAEQAFDEWKARDVVAAAIRALPLEEA